MNLEAKIREYIPVNEEEERDKEVILSLLSKYDDLLYRENLVAHFTSSCFVLNKEKTKVLFAYHNIYKSWTWLGGHTDGDGDLLHVAIKEAKEETSLQNVKALSDEIQSLEVLHVEGHEKRGKYVPSHLHLNLTFFLEADENDSIHNKEDENSAVKWIPLDEIGNYSTEKWMNERIFKKLIERIKKMS